MKQFSYTIKAAHGIHAIPAALLAQEANKYDSFISIIKSSIETDMARPVKVMAMSIKQGDTVTINIEGEDEDLAAMELEAFFRRFL